MVRRVPLPTVDAKRKKCMREILVIAYSLSGTSRRLARMLVEQHGWPIGEVFETGARQRDTLRCVLDSLLGRRPAIRYEGPDPADFGIVVLVSPIWLYRLAGPMRSFVVQRAPTLRDIAVISSMGSRGAANAGAEVASILNKTPLLATGFTERAIDEGSCIGRILAIAQALRADPAEIEPMRPALLSPNAP